MRWFADVPDVLRGTAHVFNSRALCFRLWLRNEVSEAEVGKYLCQKVVQNCLGGGQGPAS